MEAQKAISEEILQKLAKLKNLADSAPDENECINAQLAFQRLLKKHDIKESEVNLATDQNADKLVIENCFEGYRVQHWILALHSSMAKHYNCAPVLHTNGVYMEYCRHQTLQFYGVNEDPIIAKTAFLCAVNAAERLWAEKREKYMLSRDQHKEYMVGFTRGLNKAYREQEAREELGIILFEHPLITEALSAMSKGIELDLDTKGTAALRMGLQDGHNFGKGNTLREVEV